MYVVGERLWIIVDVVVVDFDLVELIVGCGVDIVIVLVVDSY